VILPFFISPGSVTYSEKCVLVGSRLGFWLGSEDGLGFTSVQKVSDRVTCTCQQTPFPRDPPATTMTTAETKERTAEVETD
jgi:hypothetical protein